MFTDFENFSEFRPATMHTGSAQLMFDQLESWTTALSTLRAPALTAA